MSAKQAKIFSVVLLLVGMAGGQELPQAPSFWTRETKVTVPTFVALMGADAYVTNRDWGHFHEVNPLMPSTTGGRGLYFLGTSVAVIGTSYLLHKTGHKSLSKWILRIGIGTEGWAVSSHF